MIAPNETVVRDDSQFRGKPTDEVLCDVRNLKMHFPVTEGVFVQRVVASVKAIDGLSFQIMKGETLGLVGESGCGKTTTGRCILQLEDPTTGEIMFHGQDINGLDKKHKFSATNPKNGDKQPISDLSWLWCLLFGVFFFVFKGWFSTTTAWKHVSFWILAAFFWGLAAALSGVTLGFDSLDNTWTIAASVVTGIAWLIYAYFARQIIINSYLKRGWSIQQRRGSGAKDSLSHKSMIDVRKKIQVIFQDPFSSLNPRMKIGEIITEPMRVHDIIPGEEARRQRAVELLTTCGLKANFYDRYPHEMSGGQRQRVGIARALAMDPEFIICDEAVSALDVSIQAQVINLLEDLREQFGLTYLFISHDLSVVRHICHRVAVMYLGHMVELADCDELFDNPLHPYTQALLEAVPIPDPDLENAREHKIIKGEIPSPMSPPSGCVFHPRCPKAVDTCLKQFPEFREVKPGHWVACTEV